MCIRDRVILDLGGVARIFNLIISPNFISPLFWDICVISCYLVINLVYLYSVSYTHLPCIYPWGFSVS